MSQNLERRIHSAQVLSHKIDLLLDVIRAEDGAHYDYRSISSAMKDQGVNLSRTRWHHLKAGTSTTAPPKELLRALAVFFEVPEEYLLHDDGQLPDRVQKELELLRTMRKNRVREFATRSLAEVDDETLQAITQLLDGLTSPNSSSAPESPRQLRGLFYAPRRDMCGTCGEHDPIMYRSANGDAAHGQRRRITKPIN